MSVIVLIEKRLFLRNCLHDCFDRSYPNRKIFGFATLAEWCDYIEEKTLNPAVVIYFALAGISPILKSEFGRIQALSPNTRIIVISDATGSDEINQVIGYGARGYIPTSMPYSLAVEAVRFVEGGGIFLPAVGNLLPSGGSHDPQATVKTSDRATNEGGRGSRSWIRQQANRPQAQLEREHGKSASSAHYEKAEIEKQDADCSMGAKHGESGSVYTGAVAWERLTVSGVFRQWNAVSRKRAEDHL